MADMRQVSAARPITPIQGRSSSANVMSLQTSGHRPLSNIGPLSPVNQNGSFAFDRVIKRGKTERRVKKKGAWKSSWKSAHLVLRPNLLSVYKDADETELRASITLSDVTAVAQVKKSHHDNVFGIFSPSKNYHFATSSVQETADWITILRLEARTEIQDDLQPPNASFRQADAHGYETTDMSADDDVEPPGSPEVPRWTVRAQKNRVLPPSAADNRKNSGLVPYPSGTDAVTTSQSDLSDHFGGSLPTSKGYLSSSVSAQPSQLEPIPDETRPTMARGASYLSDAGMSHQQVMISQPLTKNHTLPQFPSTDASRIIRQGQMKLSKTTSGVKQWKTIWMVLRSQSLSIYKSVNDSAPTTVIPVSTIVEAAEIDRKNKQNCFQVISEEKTHRLQAENETELEKWLGAFKSVLVKHEAERDPLRSRGPSMSTVTSQPQTIAPGSRDGLASASMQLRGLSLNDQQSQAMKRVVSPPALTQVSAYNQVTTGTSSGNWV